MDKSRYDYFIIWNNGFDHLNQIIRDIKLHPDFVVLFEQKITFDNNNFISDIYMCDKAPKSHIRDKSKYLYQFKNEIYFLLIKNNYPIPVKRETGSQCETINAFKIRLRNKYNPPTKDPNEQRGPLNKGVSHNHIIHASDYPEQVDYVLDYLNLPATTNYDKYSNKINIISALFNLLQKYVVLRMKNEFPCYTKGSDVDILCENMNEASNRIRKVINGFTIGEERTDHCLHLDFHNNGLDLRFDFIEFFNYKKFTIRKEFISDILNTREFKNEVYVPYKKYDELLRQIEYQEHPHKTWHNVAYDIDLYNELRN